MHESGIAAERRHLLRRNADQFQDEISLLDLYFVLVKRKMIILFTVALCVIASVIYVLFGTKEYHVTAKMLIPSPDDLILSSQSYEKLAPAKVFTEYKIILLKDEIWNDFVDEHKSLFQSQDDMKNVLQNPIELGTDESFIGEHVLVSYKSNDKDNINPVIEQYIDFVKRRYIDHLISSLNRKVIRSIEALKKDIKLTRSFEAVKRKDAIILLASDLAIAKKLNIIDSRRFTMKDQSKLTVVAGKMNVPRYMRGTKVLAAELDSLQNRVSVDSYVPGLREKQQQLAKLQVIKFDAEQFSPFVLDGTIAQAEKIKPKSRLVLALGFVFGIFLGLFMVFIVEFVQKTQKSQPE